eukprot:Hpha_TRINITY_DN13950_c0_g2::TRINITY_DN13950_c0_g2_i1::g.35424::m.35424
MLPSSGSSGAGRERLPSAVTSKAGSTASSATTGVSGAAAALAGSGAATGTRTCSNARLLVVPSSHNTATSSVLQPVTSAGSHSPSHSASTVAPTGHAGGEAGSSSTIGGVGGFPLLRLGEVAGAGTGSGTGHGLSTDAASSTGGSARTGDVAGVDPPARRALPDPRLDSELPSPPFFFLPFLPSPAWPPPFGGSCPPPFGVAALAVTAGVWEPELRRATFAAPLCRCCCWAGGCGAAGGGVSVAGGARGGGVGLGVCGAADLESAILRSIRCRLLFTRGLAPVRYHRLKPTPTHTAKATAIPMRPYHIQSGPVSSSSVCPTRSGGISHHQATGGHVLTAPHPRCF